MNGPMASITIFHWFWLLFIAKYGLLGVLSAILAAAEFALGDIPIGLAATVVAASCGELCLLANESRRQLPPLR